eukprot:10883108-Alexandrium_andersonii.AAC.1
MSNCPCTPPQAGVRGGASAIQKEFWPRGLSIGDGFAKVELDRRRRRGNGHPVIRQDASRPEARAGLHAIGGLRHEVLCPDNSRVVQCLKDRA